MQIKNPALAGFSEINQTLARGLDFLKREHQGLSEYDDGVPKAHVDKLRHLYAANRVHAASRNERLQDNAIRRER